MTDTEALIAELRAYTGDLVFGKNDADRLIDRAADALEAARSRVGVLEQALSDIAGARGIGANWMQLRARNALEGEHAD